MPRKFRCFAQRSPMFSISGKTPFFGGEGRRGMGGAQQATEGQRQEGRGTAYFLPFGRSQHEFPPVALFAQIYGFYPTFGRNLTDFCPNLWFLPHIWAKLVCFRQNYRVTLLCPIFAKISQKSGKVSSSGIELIDKLCWLSDFLSTFAG